MKGVTVPGSSSSTEKLHESGLGLGRSQKAQNSLVCLRGLSVFSIFLLLVTGEEVEKVVLLLEVEVVVEEKEVLMMEVVLTRIY